MGNQWTCALRVEDVNLRGFPTWFNVWLRDVNVWKFLCFKLLAEVCYKLPNVKDIELVSLEV
ncbi:MAG: hypothetical protein ACTS4T_01435 [Candidatus Hodgkinia cicadicola]